MSPAKSWYAVLTADVLYSKKLTSRQKLLVAVVANLSNEKGYCFASNGHFAEMMQCSVRSIQRDLDVIESEGFLGRVVKLKTNGEVEFRCLTPMSPMSRVVTPVSGGGDISDTGGGDTDVTYNNKDYLKTNSNKEEGATSDSKPPKKEENDTPQSPPQESKYPTKEEFIEYAQEKAQANGLDIDLVKVSLKFDSWKEAKWITGKGTRIRNWKSTLNNTLTYLQKDKSSSGNLKAVHRGQGTTFNEHLSQAERLKRSGVI